MNTQRFVIIMVLVLTIIMLQAGMLIIDCAHADTRFICVVTRGEWVWVRNAPSKDAEKIDTIRYGIEGEISEIVNQYAHITYRNGKTGWADVSYLEIPIEETVYNINCTGGLWKRDKPNGNCTVKIKDGVKRISVLAWRYSDTGELWALTYKGGYVKACYLDKQE